MDTTPVLSFCDFQAIREYVENSEPLLSDIWDKTFEVSDKNLMLGRVHENHLLGIFLWLYIIKKEETPRQLNITYIL